jgi:hypothetical protein
MVGQVSVQTSQLSLRHGSETDTVCFACHHSLANANTNPVFVSKAFSGMDHEDCDDRIIPAHVPFGIR